MNELSNTKEESGSLRERVARAIEEVRPYIQGDGGDVELVDVDGERGTVFVRFIGACTHCALSDITLKQGVREAIRKAAPEVQEVVSL
jgi:Fe-S cluster biogenesis protein NfuA